MVICSNLFSSIEIVQEYVCKTTVISYKAVLLILVQQAHGPVDDALDVLSVYRAHGDDSTPLGPGPAHPRGMRLVAALDIVNVLLQLGKVLLGLGQIRLGG